MAEPVCLLQREKEEDTFFAGMTPAPPKPQSLLGACVASRSPILRRRLKLDFALSACDSSCIPQLLNAKEKRNQQAELTAVKSMLATHVVAAASLQERIEAAEAQVNGSSKFF